MLYRVPERIENFNTESFLKGTNTCIAAYSSNGSKPAKPTFLTEHAIIFLLEGNKLIHHGKRLHTIDQGNAILLKRGYYLMCERPPSAPAYNSIAFYFNEELLQTFWNEFYEKFTVSCIDEVPVNAINISESFQDFRTGLQSLIHYQGQYFDALIQNKFTELILRNLDSDPNGAFCAFIAQIFRNSNLRIDQIVSENLFNPLTIADLAKMCGMSLSTFKREFKKRYHESPGKWILRKRIHHGQSLLRSTKMTVAEVAFECGFENPSYFIRTYKNIFGNTPRAHVNQKSYFLD